MISWHVLWKQSWMFASVITWAATVNELKKQLAGRTIPRDANNLIAAVLPKVIADKVKRLVGKGISTISELVEEDFEKLIWAAAHSGQYKSNSVVYDAVGHVGPDQTYREVDKNNLNVPVDQYFVVGESCNV